MLSWGLVDNDWLSFLCLRLWWLDVDVEAVHELVSEVVSHLLHGTLVEWMSDWWLLWMNLWRCILTLNMNWVVLWLSDLEKLTAHL